MHTDRNYYKRNERIGEIRLNKERKCKYCGGTLVWYDNEEGQDLYICGEYHCAEDVIVNGKVKFVRIF